jgi:molecular chaperone DnaJ
MAPRKDPYAILGVGRKATPAEIKKAYRKLARRYHPDANPDDKDAETRFKEVSEAHDVLSDPDKRAAYDRGDSGIFGGGAGGANPFGGSFDGSGLGDILSNLFGSAGGAGGRRARPGPERGRDLEAEIQIGFDQAVAGAQVPLTIPITERCTTCNGTGARPGTSATVCPRCEGRGIESQGQGMFSITQPCSRCGGSGTVIESPCPTCSGTGATRGVKRLRVNIPAGVHDGSRIRLAGKGEAGLRGGPPGDLFVITHVTPSPVFKQKGAHLEVEVPLSVVEALRGAEVEVPTLNGTKTLRVAPGTRHGTVQRLRGEGPPRPGGQSNGDIHYRFVIELPTKLTADQAKAVDALAQTMNGDPRRELFEALR